MKTIREILQAGHYVLPSLMVAMLEAREKERDEAERERVKAVSESWIEAVIKGHKVISLKSLMDNIYPPPEPEPKKLPAGWYEEIYARGSSLVYKEPEPFEPVPGRTYRRLVYEDEITPIPESAASPAQ